MTAGAGANNKCRLDVSALVFASQVQIFKQKRKKKRGKKKRKAAVIVCPIKDKGGISNSPFANKQPKKKIVLTG